MVTAGICVSCGKSPDASVAVLVYKMKGKQRVSRSFHLCDACLNPQNNKAKSELVGAFLKALHSTYERCSTVPA